MTPQTVLKDSEEKMKRALAAVTRALGEMRGGRATPAMVEHVTVECYGSSMPLKQLAAITAPEPKLLVIQPWDAKVVQDIDRAIQKAGLGFTPVVDGKVVRLPVPSLTGERRDELTKLAHKMSEEGRVSVRGVRRDANESIKTFKSQKQLSEDESFKIQEQVQQLTDKYIHEINTLLSAKERTLQSV